MRPTRSATSRRTRARTVLGALVPLVTLLAPTAGAGAIQAGAVATPAAGGTVEGTVLEEESGRAVAAATVVLEPAAVSRGDASAPDGKAGAAARTTWTDGEGRYRFRDVPPGWYRLRITRLGYRPASLWVELPDSWSIHRSLGLEVEPVALHPLDVRVGGADVARWEAAVREREGASPGRSAFGTPARRPTLDARSLSADEVARLSTLGEPDVLRALQRLPGASGQGDHSAGLWTRGTPLGMTRILLDGLPLYHPLHMGGTTSGMAAAGLEAVLFHPGVRPAALSEGAAGTVNLITRRAAADGTVGTGLSPLALHARAEDRWIGERVGLAVTARRSWWDKVAPPEIITGDREGSGTVDYWLADAVGRLDVRLGERAMLEAGGLWEEDRLDGAVGSLVGASEGRWGNRVGWLALAGSMHGVRARLTAGRTVHASRTRPWAWASFHDDRGVPTLDAMNLRLARSLLRLELGGGAGPLLWEAGVDRARETLRQRGPDASDRAAPGLREEAVVGWLRVWGQGTARWGRARVSAGAAWDAPAEGDPPELGLMPTAAVRVRVSERVTVEAARGLSRQFAYPFARAGRSFGPALGVDHVWMLAGDGRPPLTSDIGTLAVEVRLTAGFGVALTGWRREVDGLAMSGVSVVREGAVVPVDLAGAVGREEGRGVEATAWRRDGRVRGELAYSLGRSEVVGPDGSRWAPPSDRRHSLDFILTADLTSGLRAGAAFRSESGWPYLLGPWDCPDDIDPTEADACDRIPPGDPRRPLESSVERARRYESLDLLAEWVREGERLTWGVTLGVRNVLGRDNWSAWRPEGCGGIELISVVCEDPVGPGERASGLGGPTPAFSVRLLF